MSTGKDKIREMAHQIWLCANSKGYGDTHPYKRLSKTILAELDLMEAPKGLTDDTIYEIAHREWMLGSENLSYYGAKLMEVGALNALRYARDNSYFAPAPGLTVEEMVEIFDGVVRLDSQGELVLRARLTAALTAKSRTA